MCRVPRACPALTLVTLPPSPRPCARQVSAFQRHVRGDCTQLTDHISKQMNELNMERCR